MNRFSVHRIDFFLLVPSFLLVLISLTTLFSIDATLFRQQIFFLFVGFIFYLLFLNIDYRLFEIYAKHLYALMLIIFFIVLLFGTEVHGLRGWLVFFGLRVQPVELVKPFFIIFVAYCLSHIKLSNLGKYIAAVGVVAPVIFLILRQPDTGTALVYVAVFCGMLLMYGFPLYFYIISIVAVFMPMPVIFQFLRPYQKERLITLFNLTSDPLGSSYNAIQALISIGSGGFFGKGLGEGTQSVLRFLPERHTDFIFASISENFGFIGGISVICLLVFILYRIYKVSTKIKDTYPYLIVIGVFFILLVQVVINVGMNMGMVPIIGITLPFVSYGGSSLVTSFIILGIISAIGYEYKKQQSLEIQ